MKNKQFEVTYTREENFKFNAIKCKDTERKEIMALYRFLLLITDKQDKERLYFNKKDDLNNLEISLDDLLVEVRRGLKKYKFTRYSLYKKINLLKEVDLIRTVKTKSKNFKYSFCNFFGKNNVSEVINLELSKQKSNDNQNDNQTMILNDDCSNIKALSNIKSIDNDTTIISKLPYFTEEQEAIKITEELLEEYKPKKANNEFKAARERVLEKVKKYYSKICVDSAKDYIRTIIVESLTVARKLINKAKNSLRNKDNTINATNTKNVTKVKRKTVLRFQNYPQREYDCEALENELLGWDNQKKENYEYNNFEINVNDNNKSEDDIEDILLETAFC